MATRLSLLCHAPTAANHAVAFPADEPLDPQAQEKLATTSHRLGGDRIFTSPARRARETVDSLQLRATVEPGLRDCNYGRWTGRSMDDVQAEEPEALGEWLLDPAAASHGGESMLQLIARVGGWLDAQSAVPGRILAVTHASVMRAALLHVMQAAPHSFWRIDIAPLSLMKLSAHGGRWNFSSLAPALRRTERSAS